MDAIVLAAGRGERLGGRKARLLVRGETLATHHVRALRAAGFTAIVVVHPDDEESLSLFSRVVVSTEPDQAGSLALGIAACTSDVVLITPVDALPAARATLEQLIEALGPDVDAVTPTYQGQKGHPVLVRRALLDVYERQRPPLRDVLAASRRVLVETDDPNVLTDLDDAARVLAATGEEPRFG
jgi:molybdenum cofactor cytidylyltransferase